MGKFRTVLQSIGRIITIILIILNGLITFCVFLAGRDCWDVAIVFLFFTVCFILILTRPLYHYRRRKENSTNRSKLSSSIRVWVKAFDDMMLDNPPYGEDKQQRLCLNCGRVYEGKYCPDCAQDSDENMLTWRIVLVNMIEETINFDGRTIKTIYKLLRRPGDTLKDYFHGRHMRISGPVPFVFFATIVFLVFSVIFPSSDNFTFISDGSAIENAFSSLIGNYALSRSIIISLLYFLPVYFLFRNNSPVDNMHLVDYCVLNMYITGVTLWIEAFAQPLVSINQIWYIPVSIIEAVYIIWALKQFFGTGVVITTFKYGLVFIIASLLSFPFILVPGAFLDVIHTDERHRDQPMTEYSMSLVFPFFRFVNEKEIELKIDEYNKKSAPDKHLGHIRYSIEGTDLIISAIDSSQVASIDSLAYEEERAIVYSSVKEAFFDYDDKYSSYSILGDLFLYSGNLIYRIKNPNSHVTIEYVFTQEELNDLREQRLYNWGIKTRPNATKSER